MPRVFCYILNMETITNFIRQNPVPVFRLLAYKAMLGHAQCVGVEVNPLLLVTITRMSNSSNRYEKFKF